MGFFLVKVVNSTVETDVDMSSKKQEMSQPSVGRGGGVSQPSFVVTLYIPTKLKLEN